MRHELQYTKIDIWYYHIYNIYNYYSWYWSSKNSIKTSWNNSTRTSVVKLMRISMHQLHHHATIKQQHIQNPNATWPIASQIWVATWNGAHDAPVDVWPYRPIKWCQRKVPNSWGRWRYLAARSSPPARNSEHRKKGPISSPPYMAPAPSGLPSTAQKT